MKKTIVRVRPVQKISVSTNIIHDIADYDVSTTFITISDEYIKTADGHLFYVRKTK